MDKQSLPKQQQENLEKVHHILVIDDSTETRTVELTLPNYSIGRHSSNDIIFSCLKMSRHHATLLRRTDLKNNQYTYWLLDGDLQGNKSRNGILVNDKKSLIHELKNGDIIRFSTEAVAKYRVVSDLSEIEAAEDSFFTKNQIAYPIAKNNNHTVWERENITSKPQELVFNTYSEQEFISFAELCPLAIIAIDLYGQIRYLNSIANTLFPEIEQQKLNHPLLTELIELCNVHHDRILTREVTIENKTYQQTARYFPGSKLIRCYLTDLTQQKNLNEQLATQQAIYRTITKKVSEAIILVDKITKKIVEVNPITSMLLGYTIEEMLEMTIFELSFEPEKLAANLQQALAKKIGLVGTGLLRHQNGSELNVNIKINAIDSNDEAKLLCLIVDQLVADKYAPINSLAKKLSHKDLFYQQLAIALANAKRSQKLLAVKFIRLDLLPEFENNLEIETNNRLIENIEERLRSNLRAGDLIVHWQNNKFAWLIPSIDSIEEIVKVSSRVQKSLNQPFNLGNYYFSINSNIGIAIYPHDGTELHSLLNNADIALRQAQKNNDNYRFYDSNTNSQALTTSKLEELLYRAVEREELKLYYQPQNNINSKNIQGVKAAIAWEDCELGEISHTSIIKIAEQTGLIIPVGEWVIKTACIQNKIWQELGLPPLKTVVTLSPIQFQQLNLSALIQRILTETEINPALLELNFSVATLMTDGEYARQTLEQLKNLGVGIAIANLATDCYSLDLLKKLPCDILKIDLASVGELQDNSQELAVVSTLIELGKGFGLDIVVENIKNEEQAELLRSFEYKRIQGFWSSPSCSLAETTKLLSDCSKNQPQQPE